MGVSASMRTGAVLTGVVALLSSLSAAKASLGRSRASNSLQRSYAAPSSGYLPPVESSKKADASYTRPDNGYAGPEDGYSRPESSYKGGENGYQQPDDSDNRPDESYIKAEESYNRPDEVYSRPEESYNRPDEVYSRPDEVYSRPDESYNRPDESYNRPDESYNRPDESPSSSSTTFKVPQASYDQPEYKAEASATNEQTVPSRDYGVPQGNVLSFFDSNTDDLTEYKSNSNSAADDGNYLKMLMNVIPGVPGQDYPILSSIPKTSFSCEGKVLGGYYADPAADCQVFHVCSRPRVFHSFLCPNGTIFHQTYLTCDFWYNSDCAEAESLYGVNDQIQAERELIDSRQTTYQNQNTVPKYKGSQQPDTLPKYNGGGVGMYGRQAKALEIEQISITTTRPQNKSGKKKRQLGVSVRHAAKYSWASLP